MQISFYTLGCKVNRFESDAIAQEFENLGYEIVPFGQKADLFVVNTCAVTSRASYQSRQIMRRIRRTWPDARLVVTGCDVQTGSQEILEKVPGPICLVGNDQKHRLVELAASRECCMEVYVGEISRASRIAPMHTTRPIGRTRGLVRIQDGCNSFCSYCIIPYARGRSRSLAPELVHRQVRILKEYGVKEAVLTGIHIGAYGEDLPGNGPSLLTLLKQLCQSFPDIRFRLSSIEPTDVTAEMVAWASSTPNFCPHWHVPLQSGSDVILARMNRHYNTSIYREKIRTIRSLMPNACIGVDVMAGFPGEDEREFQQTVDLLEELPVTYVHAFPYSPRPGTLASALGDPISKHEKSERAKIIRILGERKKQEFYSSQAGRVLPVLFEQTDKKTGMFRGITPNYIPVLVKPPEFSLKGTILPVQITEIRDNGAFGILKTKKVG